MRTLTEHDIFSKLKPRNPESHKGHYGRVFLVCGSTYYRGAATLATTAALRCGAGIACLCSIPDVIAACAAHTPAATFLPLTEANGYIAAENIRTVCDALRPTDICVIGCGLSKSAEGAALVAGILENAPCPLVLDADAINLLAPTPRLLRNAQHTPILTPHFAEFARIFGTTVSKIGDNAAACAAEFSKTYGCVTVLKSHRTYIASPNGETVVNTTGNPGMAKGGSGDILAGMIAGFAAGGQDAFSAASIGVYLAGAAGDLCAARRSQYGMLPGEQLDDLCTLFAAHGL